MWIITTSFDYFHAQGEKRRRFCFKLLPGSIQIVWLLITFPGVWYETVEDMAQITDLEPDRCKLQHSVGAGHYDTEKSMKKGWVGLFNGNCTKLDIICPISGNVFFKQTGPETCYSCVCTRILG